MAFSLLPLEVNASIAAYLDDLSIAAFALICPTTHNAVASDGSPLWRMKFMEEYDLVPHTATSTLKHTYQHRRKWLRRGAAFKFGNSLVEVTVLKVLRSLMVDSFASGNLEHDDQGNVTSRNIRAIRAFAEAEHLVGFKDHGILANVRQPSLVPRQTNLLVAIQIMLTDVRFYHKLNWQRALGFVDAQRSVYASRDHAPIFKGRSKLEVNLPWVLNTVEFFKHHLASAENPELMSDYNRLPASEKIKAWRRPLKNGPQRLGERWRGAYAYLEHNEISILRSLGPDDDELVLDRFNTEGDGCPFQTLRLDFSQTANSAERWPKLFERHLQSLSHPSVSGLARDNSRRSASPPTSSRRSTRAQHRAEPDPVSRTQIGPVDPRPVSFSFQGSGMDEEKFFAAGWLNPLPAQEGIPGWLRWTMMKFFVNGEDEDNNMDLDDPFAMSGISETPLPFSTPKDSGPTKAWCSPAANSSSAGGGAQWMMAT